MSILCLILFTLLVLVAGVRIVSNSLSIVELTRRADGGDEKAVATLRQRACLPDIVSLQRISIAILLVLFVVVSVAGFGLMLGTLLSVVTALGYGAIAQWDFIYKRIQPLYERHESTLLTFMERYPGVFRLIRTASVDTLQEKQFDSIEELREMVAKSGTLLSKDEKMLIERSLAFDDQLVNEVMTPRSVIDVVNKNDLLGPLMLDDLHKTGHSRFPVIDGDIDHIVGMLLIRSLFSLDSQKTTTAEKAMEPKVFYIREDHTLRQALAGFLRTHHHLFVVINEFRETVGLLSLEDTLEALLGRKIVDEFDTHDDLRAVATLDPRSNNHPKTREDI